jgi:hypothetical protein
MLMNNEEGVGGSDPALSALEAQPVDSQSGIDDSSSSACCCIPSGVFRPFTSMRCRSNTDHSQRNVSDQSTQTGQGSDQAAAQIRAYLLTIPETHWPDKYKSITANYLALGPVLKTPLQTLHLNQNLKNHA